jgi:hypothetical protein
MHIATGKYHTTQMALLATRLTSGSRQGVGFLYTLSAELFAAASKGLISKGSLLRARFLRVGEFVPFRSVRFGAASCEVATWA